MVYCQECGASNTADARFCNMCGAAIAQAGEPGGPIGEDAPPAATMRGHDSPSDRPSAEPPPRAREGASDRAALSGPTPPPMSLDVSTVSLSAIGVRSRGSAWAVLIGVALAFVGLGAVGMWLALTMNDEEPAASAEEPSPTVPTEVDVPEVPEGADVEGAEVAAGEGGATTPTGRGATSGRSSGTTSGGASASTGGGRSTGTSGGSGSAGGSASTGSGGSGSTGSTGSTGGSGSGSGGTGGSASTGGTGGSTGGSGGSTGGSGGSGSAPDWDSMQQQQQDDRDFEMNLYTGRVRQFIQTYYMRRAATCFEMASRNNPNVRGRVVIAFTILADGATREARVSANETGIDSIGACLATQVGSWRLPAPPEGEAPLAMSMPFRGPTG